MRWWWWKKTREEGVVVVTLLRWRAVRLGCRLVVICLS